MVLEVLSTVCGIFLLIAIGIAAAKWGLLPEGSTAVLSKFLFQLATPAVAITTMQGRVFGGQLAQDSLWAVLSFTLATLAAGALSFLITAPFHIPERDRGIYRMQLAFKNVGFMGIPLVTAVLGREAGLLILLMNLAFIVLLYTFGTFLLLHRRGDALFSKELLRRMVNLPMLSSLGGVVILLTGIRLPEPLNSGLSLLANTMVPVGMVLVGIQLSQTKPGLLLRGQNIWFCVLSLAMVPTLALGLGLLLPQSGLVTATLVFAMAMPSGTLCAVLTQEFGRNTLLASESLALTTLLSLATLPVWAVVLKYICGL